MPLAYANEIKRKNLNFERLKLLNCNIKAEWVG